MKTKTRKMWALVCCLCISLSVSVSATSPHEKIDLKDQEITIAELAPEQIFIDSLDPSKYGGVYRNTGDDSTLYVNAVNSDAAQSIQQIANRLRSSDMPKIVVKEADYSIAELEAAKYLLADERDSLGVWGAGLNERNNTLIVYVKDRSTDRENAIRELTGINGIEFYDYHDGDFAAISSDTISPDSPTDSDISTAANITVRGGHKIDNNYTTSDGTGSIATSCVYPYSSGSDGWDVGFLSVGHALSEGDNVYYEGGTKIADCTYSQRGDGADFSFSTITQSAYNAHGYISNVNGTSQIRAEGRRAPVYGDVVYLYGWASSNRKQGTVVQATHFSAWIGTKEESWYVDGLFNYSMRPAMGDSGGPIVSQSNGKWYIVGYNVAQCVTVATKSGGMGVDIKYLEDNYNIVPCT